MKAAVWYGRQDVRVGSVEDPPNPPPGQLQVEVAWCGICGTDLHEYVGGPVYIPQRAPHPLTAVKSPVIIGHEMSGRVLAVGGGTGLLSRRPRCGVPNYRLPTVPLVPIRFHGAV